VSAERFLNRRQLGLQLDHEKSSSGGMPREEIDRSTLTKDRERDFRHHLPPVGGQRPAHSLPESGVALVEQPVQPATAPSDKKYQLRVQFAKNPSQRRR
jgi:hypothetical protein